ncbi:DEAD/DEAH box helicase [Aquiflexum lacus]|uniref:DEAD/DEAH box helicase n=1 Tax=Aquiflexum lacus TaxID=2483805 RepID=UPI0018941480|nr:DEAD/DEAH box helicase [Aquiflexum lacus]
MNQIQFQAGYLLDGINETLKTLNKSKEIKGLLKHLSCFDLETDCNISSNSNESFASVIHNIIVRGIPTRPSIFIENKFLELFQKFQCDDSDTSQQLGNIKYISLLNNDESNDVFSALHIIDPRVILNANNCDFDLESNFERDFIFKYLPTNELSFIQQLLESQRKLNTIVTPEIGHNFHSQRVDFSYEFPYELNITFEDFGEKKIRNYNQGILIEIDGTHHNLPEQVLLDKFRDNSVKETNWKTFRIKNISDKSFATWAKRSSSFKIINANYNRNLDNNWLDILQLALSPFAIARIQKTIIELILSKKVDLKAKEWNVLAIERDVPCVALAIEDLKQHFQHLFALAGKDQFFPIINLQVLSTNEFVNSKLHDTKPELISKFQSEKEFDLIIDISVLQRRGVVKSDIPFNSKIKAIIRSSHYVNSERKIYTTDLIDYKPITTKLENESYEDIQEARESLTYFLQNIFRKESFREGQLPILNRALQGKSVIGLLPTGGGKSMTYQIASLLQPGVTMVIDPIKSLMQDQFDNLLKNGIDSCNFINSKLTREEKTIATNQVTESKVLLTFVSPERLQIEEFRLSLQEMYNNKVFFSYCVIDEVHCVSEWGHDFRTSYLCLGRNVIDYCKTKNKQTIPIFGLTATASFDVLSDVERELSGNGLANIDTDAIVRFENTNRTELQYQIFNTIVNFERDNNFKFILSDKTEILLPFQPIKGDIRKQTALEKQSALTKIVEFVPNRISELNEQTKTILEWTKEKFSVEGNLPNIKIENFDISSFYNSSEQNNKLIFNNGGIVFCPHRKSLFGVTDKFESDKYEEDIRDKDGNIIHKRGDFVIDENGKKVKLPLPKRKAIADVLTKQGKYEIGIFMGSSDEDEKVGKEIETESFGNQKKFIDNEQNIMVATKAFGMGIDKPNVRFTVHVNIPASIESFVQEAGRAGRDRKMALSTILFNEQKVAIFNQRFYEILESDISEEALKLLKRFKNQKFYLEEVPEILKAIENEELKHSEKKILESLGEIFIDKDNLLFFHNNSFKGQEKEFVVIKELLEEILFPNNNKLREISEALIDETGEEGLRLSVFMNYLNIFNENNGKIGGINLVNLNRSFHNIVCSQEYSNQIVNVVIHKIQDKFFELNDVDLLKKWLEVKTNESSEIGIEQRLIEVDFHQEVNPEIVIPFANKFADKNIFYEEIKALFKTIITDVASDSVIIESIEGNFENFLKNVKEKLNIEIEANGNNLEKLKQLYYSPRNKADTDKAIFRLSSIGIIDDYTVDYNQKSYKISVVKKTDDEYIEHLKIFMRKYYSANRVEREIENVFNAKGETILQKCLSFLTNFVYEEIEKKRMRSIDDMILACQTGMSKNGNEELKDFIHLYFNSKYAKLNHTIDVENYSLTLDTDNAKDFSFEILWKYIKATTIDPSGAQKDNTKHLRGAALRLLRTEPKNGVLLLLKAYSLFVLGIGSNKNIENEAKTSLTLGFKLFKEKYTDLPFEELSQIIERYKTEIIKNAHDSQEVANILDVIIEELYLEFHNDWLKDFNQKYLLEYDR